MVLPPQRFLSRKPTFNHWLVNTNTTDLLLLLQLPHYDYELLKSKKFLLFTSIN